MSNESNLLTQSGTVATVGQAAVAGVEPIETTAGTPQKAGGFHIPSLDGIRAISFFLVFVAHAGLGNIVPGGFGVTIFFFLSGYLITTLLRIEYDKTNTISFGAFYLRRTLRIFPPLYLVLFSGLLLTQLGVLTSTLKLPAVIAQIFYLGNYYAIFNNFDGIVPGTAIFWSLAIEEHFYLVFPLLYLLLRRYLPARHHQALVIGGLCVAVLIWRCVLVYGLGSSDLRTYLATDARIDSILFGCLLAVYGNPMFDKTRLSEQLWVFVMLPLGIAMILLSLTFRDPQFRETFRYSIQSVALIPLFAAAIRFPRHPMISWLNLRWLSFLGVLSYSLYLVHQVYLYIVEQWIDLPMFPQAVIALALSIITALAMYHGIERPFAQLRRKLLSAA